VIGASMATGDQAGVPGPLAHGRDRSIFERRRESNLFPSINSLSVIKSVRLDPQAIAP